MSDDIEKIASRIILMSARGDIAPISAKDALSIAEAVAPCRDRVLSVFREIVAAVDVKHGWHVRATFENALTAINSPPPMKNVVGGRYCIRCGGVEHIPEDDITCTICVEAIRNGTEPNGADRSPKPKRQLPMLDVEEIASMLYEAANPTMRWSYLYPSHNHLHAAVRQRFLDAAARFQGALASAEVIKVLSDDLRDYPSPQKR